MPTIKVPTSFNIDVEFAIPEFYRRLIALLIDLLILFFYKRIADLMLGLITNGNVWDIDDYYNTWGLAMLFYLPIFLYHIVSEILMNGQSVGKKIIGLRVVNENGGRPAISQFLIRWFLRDIWFFILFLIGIYTATMGSKTEGVILVIAVIFYFIAEVVLVVSSKKGQRIGDIMAHTILIRTNPKASIEDTVFQEMADSYVPVFPQIMQLSDKDINAIKSILENARKKGDFQLASIAADKIKNHLNINNSMSPFDFLDTVLKDYNYLSVK